MLIEPTLPAVAEVRATRVDKHSPLRALGLGEGLRKMPEGLASAVDHEMLPMTTSLGVAATDAYGGLPTQPGDPRPR